MITRDPDFAPAVDFDVVRNPVAASPQRLLSIDVLRGLTIAFMILVNNQVGAHPFVELAHARWNGFTATDLVFPTFLFLVGLSTVLSTAARTARGASRRELLLHAFRRALLLILFGFVVNNFPLFHLATARYYGVLPRIGVCYLFVASLYLLSNRWKDKVALAVVCLVGYWALMRFVPVPGFGIPTHTLPINDPDGNLTAWLDRQVFSAPHLYERTRDPEGLLSTIPALAMSLFGMLAAMWLRTTRSTARKAAMLAVAGILFLGVALAWNPFFPINKKLWTSSFALFSGGWSLLLLAAAIYLIDHKRLGRPKADSAIHANNLLPGSASHPPVYTPLLVFGTNAIAAYMISELGDKLLHVIHSAGGISLRRVIYARISATIPQPEWSSLIYSAAFVLVCWILVLPLYRKRIFLRI